MNKSKLTHASDVTINDGTTTGIFDPAPAPEPGTMALSLLGGLAARYIYMGRRGTSGLTDFKGHGFGMVGRWHDGGLVFHVMP